MLICFTRKLPAIIAIDSMSTVEDSAPDKNFGELGEGLSPGVHVHPCTGEELFYQHGRGYHNFRRGLYPYPADQREIDRQDYLHVYLTEDLERPLYTAPVQCNGRLTRVLDVGTGTGFWSIDVGRKMITEDVNAEIIGIDLVNMQWQDNHPPNLRFYTQVDFEEQWTLGRFDLIHLRCCNGGVSDWCAMYRKIYQSVHPSL